MLKRLKKIQSEVLTTNPWWEYRRDIYMNPKGKESEYHFVHTPGSVFVVPELNESSFVLTKQYRYLNQRISIEFPGGGIKKGKTAEQNAREELEEEAGYISNNLKLIGQFNPFNGVTDEICSVFHAKELIKTELRPEPSEEFEIIILTKEEIINKINKGEIWDGMTLAAWTLFYFSERNK